jgi:hypothetical protein
MLEWTATSAEPYVKRTFVRQANPQVGVSAHGVAVGAEDPA